MRIPRSFAVPIVLATLVFTLVPLQGAAAVKTAALTINRVQIAPGTFFSWGKDVSGGHTRHLSILEVHPGGTGATIDTAMPKTSMPGSAGISTMVPIETNAIAGINGDFGGTRPNHAVRVDGDLWQSGLQPGTAFGVRRDEKGAYVGKPHVAITVRTPSSALSVDRINSSAGLPASQAKTEIAMFSPRGGTADRPAVKVCAVRLKNPSPLDWAAQNKGVQATYTVDAQKCAANGATATPLPVQANTLVLTSMMGPGTKQSQIKAFGSLVGRHVTVRWAMGGFPDVLDAIGGDPQLLVNGVVNTTVLNQASCKKGATIGCSNPRTAIGINKACVTATGDCTIWMIVVDGRQGASWSEGMCLTDNKTSISACNNGAIGLAHYLKILGAYDAINLDGGGSTGMWIKRASLTGAGISTSTVCQTVAKAANGTIGCFVNRPTTDGTHIQERPAQSAVMVLNGQDTNEPL